jgi:hypothetical protein
MGVVSHGGTGTRRKEETKKLRREEAVAIATGFHTSHPWPVKPCFIWLKPLARESFFHRATTRNYFYPRISLLFTNGSRCARMGVVSHGGTKPQRALAGVAGSPFQAPGGPVCVSSGSTLEASFIAVPAVTHSLERLG